VARDKPFADRVRWLEGDWRTLPPLQVDAAAMTGNVAEVFLSDEGWMGNLRATHAALRPGGHLVFEVRDPENEAWREWNREESYRRIDVPRAGVVEAWVELTDVSPPLVSFRHTFIFEEDGAVLTSDSTLRFRDEAEIRLSLRHAGLVVLEVREAPDRPGREFVFISRRGSSQTP
jgi:SAM-dependent methyltransferase